MECPQDSCRLCAKPFEETFLLHIFKKNTSSTDSLDSMINKYMPFTVTTNDNLPLKVCKMCSANVINWHRYVMLCVKAQMKLRKKLQENERPTVSKWLENQERNSNATKDTFKGPFVQTVCNSLQLSVTPTTLTVNPVAKKKVSTYCIARWCNNGNDLGISLFRIPKDKNRALQWLSAADRMDLADKDTAYVHRCYLCATHFAKEMFVNEHCKSLNRNAVPSIFPKPIYAEKIEQDLIKSSTYPKELQGVRLKYILPKLAQKPQETIKGSSVNSNTQQHNIPIVTVLTESNGEFAEQAEQIQVFGAGAQNSASVHIFDLSSDFGDLSKNLSPLNKSCQENFLQDQTKAFSLVPDLTGKRSSESLPSEVTSNVIKDAMETGLSDKQQQGTTGSFSVNEAYLPDTFSMVQDHLDHTHAEVLCRDVVCDNSIGLSDGTEKQKRQSNIPNTLMDFISTDEPYSEADNVLMLELGQKSTNAKAASLNSNPVNFPENHHETSNSFGCQVTPSGDSFSALSGTQPFPSNDSTLLIPDSVTFGLKGTMSEDVDSACLNNMVGSQDVLLMHSSSSQVEQTQGQRLRQNADNLCCTIVSESVSEPIAYEDRAMIAEVNARSMECTSPTHGQVIEGLIDLDHFLDSA